MKARSAGLEIEIRISEDERNQIRDGGLRGILCFDDRMLRRREGIKRDIPLILKYKKGTDNVEVEGQPERIYFGLKNNIEIYLGDYQYNCLMEKGRCGDRFWSSGRISIMVEMRT